MSKQTHAPARTVSRFDVPEDKRVKSSERCECPACEKTFAGGSVITSEPTFVGNGEYEVTRRLYCDHCNHIIKWRQRSDPKGGNLGPLMTKPVLITRSLSINAFLRTYPQAAGLTQE